MEIRSSLATQGYTQAIQAAKPVPSGGGGGAFASMAQDFLATMRSGEETVTAGLAGRADAQAVVQALAQTELAFQTVSAVRDKVVEAYQEILRMPV